MGEKVLMSKETVAELEKKIKFSNKIAEALDATAFGLVNKLLLNKIAEKLPDDILPVVQEALKTVIEEMPEIEI